MDPRLAAKLLICSVMVTDFRLSLHQQPLRTGVMAAVWDSSSLTSIPSHPFFATTSASVGTDITVATKDCRDRGDGQPVRSHTRMKILWTCLVLITLGVIVAFGVFLFRRIARRRRNLPPGIVLVTWSN